MDNNLYSNNNSNNESYPVDYMELLDQMNRINKALRHVQKKQKKRKRKKGSSKNKKLRKRIKAFEKQNEQMANSIQVLAAIQMQSEPDSSWWQKVLENSAPKLIDLASNVVKNRQQPTVQVLPARKQLYITDGSEKK